MYWYKNYRSQKQAPTKLLQKAFLQLNGSPEQLWFIHFFMIIDDWSAD